MTTSTRISEAKDVAGPIVAHLSAMRNASVRQELPIVLNGTTANLDCLCRIVKPEREDFLAVEFKVGITDELIEQAERWLEKANQVFVGVYEPEKRSTRHTILRRKLGSLGIGLFYARAGIATLSMPATWKSVDTRLLAHAFDSHDGSLDPAAGSAAAKRMHGEPALLNRIAKAIGDGFAYIAQIQRLHVDFALITAHRLRQSIKRYPHAGLSFRGHARTEFYATGETK